MKYIINTILLLTLTFSAQAQLGVSFESADTTPAAGSKVNVNVTVDNFVDINSLQFWLYWDSTVLEFDTITNFAPGLNTSSSTFNLSSINYPGNIITVNGQPAQYPDGQLAVSWENGLDVTTLPDGSAFFTICFNAIGLECAETALTLGDNPPFGEIEVYANFDFAIDSNLGASADSLPFQIAGNCDGEPTCDFEFTASAEQGVENNSVCAFITADGFVDVESFQGGLIYDPSVLEFTGFEFTNLPMGSQGVAESSPGDLSFLWVFDPTTVPDGTQVLKLTFNTIGNIGDVSSLEFQDIGNITLEVIGGGQSLDLCLNNGSVTVVEEIVPEFSLNIDDVTVTDGQQACFPVYVNNFINITTMQFTLEWDDDIFTFTNVQNLNTDIGVNMNSHINQLGNVCNVSWSSASGGGQTIADGSVIFEICFDIDVDCSGAAEGQTFDHVLDIVGNPDIEIAAEYDGGIVEVPFSTSNATVTVDCSGPVDCNDVTIAISTELTPVSCFGESNGSVILTSSGGTAPYSCLWENINGVQVNTGGNCLIQNLAAGTYCVTVTDSSPTMCTATECIQITQPSTAISISASSTSATCTSGGNITTTVLGATGNPSYNWSGGLSGANPTNVPAGNYTVVVTDGGGCTASTSVAVGSVSDISVNGTSSNVDCDNAGSISTTVSGSNTNLEYCWSDISIKTLPNRTGLNPGNYTVTVTDTSTGCSDVMSWTITNTVTPISAALVGQPTNIDCNNTTGSIAYSLSGGCPTNGTYTCTLNGTPVACNGSLDMLPEGSHVLVISDGVNTDVSIPFEITTVLTDVEIVGTLMPNSVTCNGGNDGGLPGVNVIGGCPSANGHECTLNGQTVDCASIDGLALEAGDYTLIVTDANGSSDSQQFSVTEPEVIVIELNNLDDTFCQGLIDINVSGGNGGFSFDWSNDETSEDILNLCPGEYCVTVSDSEGCEATFCETIGSSLILDNIEVVSESGFAGFGVSCFGTCDGVIDGTQSVGGSITITLTETTSGQATTYTELPITGICPGTYSFSAVDEFDATFTWPTDIEVTEPPVLTLELDQMVPCDAGMDNGALSIFVEGGVGDYTIEWTPNVGSTTTVTNLSEGLYSVEVSDANECEVILSELEVTCETEGTCYQGDAIITPNNDGVNDVFEITCLNDLESHNVGMYDRWGRQIFSTSSYDQQWNGLDSDGDELGEGTYFWVLEASFDNGDRRIFKGTTTLLR